MVREGPARTGMSHCIDIKVYYEDTDCGGVVYYGKYLGFLERARTEFLEHRGIILTELMSQGINFVVVHVDIKYLAAARYGDVISIASDICEITGATMTFRHELFVKKHPERRIAEALVRLACVGSDMKPRRLTKEIADAVESSRRQSE